MRKVKIGMLYTYVRLLKSPRRGYSYIYRPPMKLFLLRPNYSKYLCYVNFNLHLYINRGRTGLVVRASDSGSGDPGSILGRVGVLFP